MSNSIANHMDFSKHFSYEFTDFFDRFIGDSLLRRCHIENFGDKVESNRVFEYADNPVYRLLGSVPDKSRMAHDVKSAKKVFFDRIKVGFLPESTYRLFQNNYFGYGKDVFYRFDRKENVNWENLQMHSAKNLICQIVSETDKNTIHAMAFDDSLRPVEGGKGTELCGKVYDHVSHKMCTGYRSMNAVWTDGQNTVPFAQQLLTTSRDELMVGPTEKFDGRTLCGKRRIQAREKGTDCIISMAKKAKAMGVPLDYVLFDTWFSNPKQLVQLKNEEINAIGMVKKNGTKYTVEIKDEATGLTESKKLDVKKIYSHFKKKADARENSKYILSVQAKATDNATGESIDVKLVFAKNRNNKKDWVCFVCTDASLDAETVIRVYTYRWNIEVYFKICKSTLKFRGCHSTSFDSLTADLVFVAIRYMFLSYKRYCCSDDRTIEELFSETLRHVYSEMMDMSILLILDTMLESVCEVFHATEEKIQELIAVFISKLPKVWSARFSVQSKVSA